MAATDRSGAGASMVGKTVVITGATSGLGAVAAEVLAQRGARLVLIARDRARADRAEPTIDVLANNAGALYGKRELTVDGFERTFATNHLAYFVLTLGLKAPLSAAGAARVVSTSSGAHRGASYDPSDLQTARGYSAIKAYSRSKLDNILFTRELARRWKPLGITANCFHPGFVATRFGDNTGGWMSAAIGAMKFFAITPEKGARTLIYLASAPEAAGKTGDYFYECAVAEPRPAARDDAAAASLWSASLALSGLTDSP